MIMLMLIWLGLICCGIANGLIYDHVQVPERYYYMMLVLFIGVIILLIHRFYTWKWKPTKDVNYQHVPLFISSMITSIIVGVSSLFGINTGELSWGFFFGCITGFLVFGLASLRENYYL